jgi:hypothetical protein
LNKFFSCLVFIFFGLSLITVTGAGEKRPTFPIYERTQRGRVELKEREISGLLNDAFFETEHFKVVDALHEEPLPTALSETMNEDLRQRAASALYHLEKARRFFIENIGYEEALKLPKAVIRLNMPYAYLSPQQEKVNLKQANVFNNVQTIPGFAGKWDSEIWFRPKKVVYQDELQKKASRRAVKSEVNTIRKVFLDIQIDTTIRSVLQGLFSSEAGEAFLVKSLSTQLRSFLFSEILFEGFKVFNAFATDRKYYSIPELIPEVVYHEYAHFAFQPYLVPSHSIAVPEAMANFFAGLMIDSPEIAAKFRRAFRGKRTNGRSADRYELSTESRNNVRNDFTFSFMWQLQDVFGETKAKQLLLSLIRSGKLRTEEAMFEPTFKELLIDTLYEITPEATDFTENLKLHAYFLEKGTF